MQVLLTFIKPIVIFFVSVAGIVGVVIGAIENPEGFLNTIICGVIDMIATFLPSTPDNLKIANIVDSLASQMPAVGRYIILDTLQTISSIAGISVAIKVYKLIPLKAT